MKYFIYTYSEKQGRKHFGVSHCEKTVRLYRVVRNVPHFLGTLTETYVDQWQLVMMALEKFKALPKRAFERHPMGGWHHSRLSLRDDGIATVTQVS